MHEPARSPLPDAWWVHVVGGAVAGVVAGLFGVGGGILLVPLLVLALSKPQHVAHATSLVGVVFAATSGAVRFALADHVAFVGAAALVGGAVVGARLGAGLAHRLPERQLKQVFSGVLLLLALRFVLLGAGGEASVAGDTVPAFTAGVVVLHVLGGLAAGVVSSSLGVGGGVVMVPLMVLAFGYGQQVAEGTSLAVIVPTAVVGAWSHSRHGYTDWRLGARLGAGSLTGGVIGASMALALEPDVLARLFGGLMLLVALLFVQRIRREVRGRAASPTNPSS